MKKHFITYGTNKYYHSKFRLIKQVESLNLFDSVNAYDEKSLTIDFKEKHREVLSNKHGGGFWIWKLDIIKEKLDKLRDGDFLIYADAGCVINNEGKERLLEYFDMLNKSEYGIISFQMDHKELNWTTSDVFKYFDVDLKSTIANSGQIMATILIMQKKPHLLKIIEETYKVLDYDDKLFTNEYGSVDNKKTQHAGFKDTRHDQSIMSVIRKIHGSIILSDETLSHLPESKKWPIWAKRLK